MRRDKYTLLLSTVCLTVLILILGHFLYQYFSDSNSPLPPPEPVRGQTADPLPVELPPPPLQGKSFQIHGRITQADLKGIEGLEIACGAEVAVSAAAGVFRFPESPRVSPAPLMIRRDREELDRKSVV